MDPDRSWPSGAATGIGSLPGSDPREAARLVGGELPEIPHLAELPGRGAGADLVGRGATFLTGLHVDLQPPGWRFVGRPGVDERRARDFLARDLDALEESMVAHTGWLKLQVAGPWTLAANVELPRGDKALADPAAVRDVAGALADGVAAHVADIRRRVPAAQLLLQLDEPSLPTVLLGRVPTASGFGALPAVEDSIAVERLRDVVAAATAAGATPVVHCCGRRPPIQLLVAAGARAVSVDATLLTPYDDDAIGAAVEAGAGLLLGLVSALDVDRDPSTAALIRPARHLWGRLGFAPELLPQTAVVTPTCGLAGASPAWARQAMARARELAGALLEAPEDDGR